MDVNACRLPLQRMASRRQLEAHILDHSRLSSDGLARTEANEIVSTTIMHVQLLFTLRHFFEKVKLNSFKTVLAIFEIKFFFQQRKFSSILSSLLTLVECAVTLACDDSEIS